jgi:hypothetical protein
VRRGSDPNIPVVEKGGFEKTESEGAVEAEIAYGGPSRHAQIGRAASPPEKFGFEQVPLRGASL